MRTYGRNASGTWVEIDDPSYISLATLAQCLRLQTGESPFYANYGISAQQSIMTQIAPDADVSKTQAQFASQFSSLVVSRVAGASVPTYNVLARFLNGTITQAQVAT